MPTVCVWERVREIQTQTDSGERPGASLFTTHCFAFEKIEGPSPGKNDGKTLPFREIPVGPEEKVKPGVDNMKTSPRESSANHIAWINIFVSNIMHKSCFGPVWATTITFLPAPLK